MVSVGSFHSKSGSSSSQLDTGDAHVCHICLKQFSRRDLRERHRRRCEKSIGKVIPTKKRSCERCISFKVKCDYEKPSCSRCLNRSVPCEYKLEPRVKMPVNPAFGLGTNAAFSGSMDVFSLQHGQAAADVDHMDQYLGSMPMAAQDMGLDFTTSSISNDTLVGQGFYTGNEYYQHSSHSSHSHHEGSSNGHSSPWDATTVWSDGSSSVPDPVMLDELAMDSTWTQNMFDPSMCMDSYGEHNMTYYNQGVQPAQQYGHSGKAHGRPTSISY